MKNYIIATLLVFILVLGTFLFKNSKTLGTPFSIGEETWTQEANGVDVPLFLFVFFKKYNCNDFLEVIQTLNSFSQIIVIGIVPKPELKNEKEFCTINGIIFLQESINKYCKFHLWHISIHC